MEEAIYEIRIAGQLEPHWAAWFADMEVRQTALNQTILYGTITDQSALHGVLEKIRDLGLTLLSVNRLNAPQDGSTMHP